VIGISRKHCSSIGMESLMLDFLSGRTVLHTQVCH